MTKFDLKLAHLGIDLWSQDLLHFLVADGLWLVFSLENLEYSTGH